MATDPRDELDQPWILGGFAIVGLSGALVGALIVVVIWWLS